MTRRQTCTALPASGVACCKLFDMITLQMTLTGDLRERVQSAPAGSFWRVEDVAGPRSAVDTAFHRLAAEGELVRVRRGLYWKGARSRYGPGRPSALDIGLAAAGRGAGPTGWAAARALGLTTQVPAVPELAVVGRPPTGVDGVRYRSRSNYGRLELRPLEVALLEALREWPKFTEGGRADLLEAVRRLADEGRIDFERTAAVTEHEPSPRARELIRRLSEEVSCSPEAA